MMFGRLRRTLHGWLSHRLWRGEDPSIYGVSRLITHELFNILLDLCFASIEDRRFLVQCRMFAEILLTVQELLKVGKHLLLAKVYLSS